MYTHRLAAVPAALLAASLALPLTAEARMYQWVNPGSGVTQMSGKPPPWYRSGRAGPRVVVFNNGALVDDTDIALTPDQALELRDEAFAKAEESTRAAAIRQLEKAAARDAARRLRARQRSEDAEREAAPVAVPEARGAEVAAAPSRPEVPASDGEGPLDPAFVGQLKALIEAFDRQSAAGPVAQ